ncbi:50S ribosomal protein L23 [Syntrophus aciditrophicus]|uniref:Large ribosomal subunit protein uL23 n=1 Tax=Syntrophus aciditrophicus (strain SB) TaxID=56780 RepID=RL23_SYNAS|nr:50S ribosomal protein L23 [Syntrophus aciditrophicus]Q2LQ99.1 RecName: Full=Large ribosomal subunit protein uL23; AltName: Full=50S ribosomal protein L23 [Syntrophus aciditrophicus SB]ABC76182.1 LSU ribosomal protein L23P [Syntrophus aciditrophicus SB]OPY17609.1 MAG: 50S ribosomal protein L23 [Syntrophus sp. PtaB.Bin075]
MTELHQIVKRMLVTEKSTLEKDEKNKYYFEVDRRANKIEIRKAVERLLKVTVDDVHVINIKGKKKRTGRIIGKRRDWKKAVVTLAQGNTIDIYHGV